MREEITRLMSLQAIDRELQELEQSLSSVAGHVEQLRQEIDVQQAELDHLLAEDQQGAVNRRQLERELAEGEARIRTKRMRLNQVRNDKELQAIAHEVETQKETNQRLEAELLAAMEVAEPRTPRIKELSEALAKKRAELIIAQAEIIAQRHAHGQGTGGECSFARYLGKTIPWAGIKTIVATENSISDKWSKIERDGTFEFDCQVGNAQARIQAMRRRDCTGRTGFDAPLARSTAI